MLLNVDGADGGFVSVIIFIVASLWLGKLTSIIMIVVVGVCVWSYRRRHKSSIR